MLWVAALGHGEGPPLRPSHWDRKLWRERLRLLAQDGGLWRRVVATGGGLWQGQGPQPAREVSSLCQRVLVSLLSYRSAVLLYHNNSWTLTHHARLSFSMYRCLLAYKALPCQQARCLRAAVPCIEGLCVVSLSFASLQHRMAIVEWGPLPKHELRQVHRLLQPGAAVQRGLWFHQSVHGSWRHQLWLDDRCLTPILLSARAVNGHPSYKSPAGLLQHAKVASRKGLSSIKVALR